MKVYRLLIATIWIICLWIAIGLILTAVREGPYIWLLPSVGAGAMSTWIFSRGK